MIRNTAISLASCVAFLHAEEAAKPVFRDTVTHEQLSKLRLGAQANDPMKALAKSEGDDPSKVNQPQNLLASSDLISFQGLTTLVPKRAIMMLPEKFKDRINNHQQGNRVVGWLDFYSANRGWITTVEINRAQAGGSERLDEALSEQLEKSKNMVVSVMESGPISYLPYREEDEKNEEGELK